MKILITLLLTMLCMYAKPARSALNHTEYRIIANEEAKVITLPELVYIYKGRLTRWEDGSRVTLYAVKLSDRLQLRFAREVLGIGSSSFKSYIRKNKAAVIVKSRRALITKVANTSGSLAMVSNDTYIMNIDNNVYEVKVVEE